MANRLHRETGPGSSKDEVVLHSADAECASPGPKPWQAGRRSRLDSLIDEYQSQARYVVTTTELVGAGLTPSELRTPLQRLVRAGRLAKVGYRRGIWLIVPLEYRNLGGPPAMWVLHDIMQAMDTPYYVAARSAAEQYGATHHAMQTLQVAVGRRLKPMQIGRQRLRFIFRRDIERVPTRTLPNGVAPVQISTPEATVLDLVRLMSASGGLSAVAGAITQMGADLTEGGWKIALNAIRDAPSTQRAGYLLSMIGDRKSARACHQWLEAHPHRAVPLEHGPHASGVASSPVDPTWKVVVNADPDLQL
jgi:predicted transcriptional regulator of viral defense system